MKTTIVASIVAVVSALVLAFGATAAKPVDYGITVDQGAGPFAIGSQITVTTDPAQTVGAWITVQCYKAGTYDARRDTGSLLLSETHADYNDGTAYGWGKPFTLGPTYAWQDYGLGPADCVAALRLAKRGSIVDSRPLATAVFTVS